MDMMRLSIAAFTLIGWLGLIGASGVVTRVHAEDSFDGHRLFFTEAQRKQASLKESDVSPDSLPGTSGQGLENVEKKRGTSTAERAHANSVDSSDTRQRPFSTVRDKDSANNYHVYFTGLVTGKRQPRVLVNGLPCEPVSTEHSGKTDQPASINCHGVRNDELRLTVLIASGELLITDGDGRVHHLLPGEGM